METNENSELEKQLQTIEDSKVRLLSKEDNKLMRQLIEISAMELKTEAIKKSKTPL